MLSLCLSHPYRHYEPETSITTNYMYPGSVQYVHTGSSHRPTKLIVTECVCVAVKQTLSWSEYQFPSPHYEPETSITTNYMYPGSVQYVHTGSSHRPTKLIVTECVCVAVKQTFSWSEYQFPSMVQFWILFSSRCIGFCWSHWLLHFSDTIAQCHAHQLFCKNEKST
ncbi:hypothetical protein VPH35_129051 [Triticum aestivum]